MRDLCVGTTKRLIPVCIFTLWRSDRWRILVILRALFVWFLCHRLPMLSWNVARDGEGEACRLHDKLFLLLRLNLSFVGGGEFGITKHKECVYVNMIRFERKASMLMDSHSTGRSYKQFRIINYCSRVAMSQNSHNIINFQETTTAEPLITVVEC